LFHLFEQPSVVACLIDRRLQLLAELRQAFETLLVREILVQGIFGGHVGTECYANW
jgi:hypothetical protein